jgi:hypothetical protein
MPQREDAYRGRFITGGDHPSTDPRKAAIRKGAFIAGGPIVKHAKPLPPDLEHFAEAVAAAGSLYGPAYEKLQREQAEISRRLAEAKQRIEEFSAARRRR